MRHEPGQYIVSIRFWCSHIRPPAQRDVAGSISAMFLFFLFFFSLKKLSQLDAIELARCPWASYVALSELDGAEPARCSWASSQKLPNLVNCIKLPGSIPTDYFSTRYGTSEKAQGDCQNIPLMKLSQLHVFELARKNGRLWIPLFKYNII